MNSGCFPADWPAPASVRTLISTRQGGVSEAILNKKFQSNNMALHVGDNPRHVANNRGRLLASAPSIARIQWLHQVHGVEIVDAGAGGQIVEADGCMTNVAGSACAVLTADCLPVLLCDRQGTQVAAIHAGWRGLAAGILPAALRRFAAEPAQLLVYLGPAISQAHFEVGPEVRQSFMESPDAKTFGAHYLKDVENAFIPSPVAGRFCADLYSLARSQCAALGVTGVYGGGFCTYSDSQKFYSFRRDGETGRMASLIWLAH